MLAYSPRRRSRLDPGHLLLGGIVVALAITLALLPPLYGALLVAGAIGSTIVLVEPRWGFYLLLLSIPTQDFGAVGELTITNVIFGVTLLGWLLRRVVIARQPLPRTAIGPLFTLFVVILALSLVVARDLEPGIKALFQWVKSLIVFFMALDLLRTRRQTVGAIAALLLAGMGEATLGLVQYGTGAGPESFAIGNQFSRAYGTFGRPNSYAGYLEMLFPLGLIVTLAIWLQWRSPQRATTRSAAQGIHNSSTHSGRATASFARSRWLGPAALATFVIGAAIGASFSRGAWLGTLAGFAVMAIIAGPRPRTAALTLGLLGGLAWLGGIASVLPPGINDRLALLIGAGETPDVRTAFITAQNFAVVERLAHWEAGLNMFRAFPLLGVGLGNFNVRYSEFNVSPTFLISQGHAHNYYIHVAAEAGILGLGSYLLLLATIVIGSLAILRRVTRDHDDSLARMLVITCLGIVAAVGVHNIFENLHVLSMGIQLSVIWALPTIVTQPGWQQEQVTMADASAARSAT